MMPFSQQASCLLALDTVTFVKRKATMLACKLKKRKGYEVVIACNTHATSTWFANLNGRLLTDDQPETFIVMPRQTISKEGKYMPQEVHPDSPTWTFQGRSPPYSLHERLAGLPLTPMIDRCMALETKGARMWRPGEGTCHTNYTHRYMRSPPSCKVAVLLLFAKI